MLAKCAGSMRWICAPTMANTALFCTVNTVIYGQPKSSRLPYEFRGRKFLANRDNFRLEKKT